MWIYGKRYYEQKGSRDATYDSHLLTSSFSENLCLVLNFSLQHGCKMVFSRVLPSELGVEKKDMA